ncbi:MAG: chemotaxis protein CheA, partial [Clostridiales bacterium]|nr:chemotaxis protein CheA [Clostridiales bacterium]
MTRYLNAFIDEANGHIQALNRNLLELERDPGNAGVVNELFRSVHTLKGSSAAMGFHGLARLTHEMENALEAVRSADDRRRAQMVEILFRCVDALETILYHVVDENGEGGADYDGLIFELAAICGTQGGSVNPPDERPCVYDGRAGAAGEQESARGEWEYSPEAEAPASAPLAACGAEDYQRRYNRFERNVFRSAVSDGRSVFEIRVRLDRDCLMKGARVFIIFQAIGRLGEIITSNPKADEIEDERFGFEFSVTLVTQADEERLRGMLSGISEVERVDLRRLDPELVCASADEFAGADADASGAAPTASEPTASRPPTLTPPPRAGVSVRVDVEKLDALCDIVSELLAQEARLESLLQNARPQPLTETIEAMRYVLERLRETVIKVRTAPAGAVFNRIPMMVRDITKKLGKEVDLVVESEETELDKVVIDELGEPLLHIVRNALDHGVEAPEIRAARGKPGKAAIFLRAYSSGGHFHIEVEDDGAGVDIEGVRKSAAASGAISAEAAASASEKDVLRLIFLPSVSTRDTVTEFSGRGVGLDVVKTRVEALGGTVFAESAELRGTKVTIRIPLSLAILRALLVRVGGEIYAIPLGAVDSVVHVRGDEVMSARNREVVVLHDQIIPLTRLSSALGVEAGRGAEERLTCVVVRAGGEFAALAADRVIGQREIVRKPVKAQQLCDTKYVIGASVLNDGSVSMILDINALV